MKHESFAPVLIPTLCRYKHFKRCVESLLNCTYSQYTDLYVALDYPLNENHWDGYKKIKIFLNEFNGFKSIHIIERESNFGSNKNIREAKEAILQKYDCFILSEDDNEFSPNFLDYMNSCLKRYENDEDVLAVTGYNRMIDMSGYEFNIYSAISFSAWGIGYWKSKQQFLYKNIITKDYAENILSSWRSSYKIYIFSPSLLRGLMNIIKTNRLTGDTLIVSYMKLNNKYCIWPTISKVRNHGFEGGGEHFGNNPNHPMLSQKIDENDYFDLDQIEIKENHLLTLKTKQYSKLNFSNKLINRVYIPVRYFIFRLTGKVIYK